MKKPFHVRTLFFVVTISLSACSEDPGGTTEADTSDASEDLSDTGLNFDVSVADQSGSGELCMGSPVGSPVPQLETDTGVSVHWPLAEGCIAFTYDSDLADEVGDMRSAVDVWNQIDCSVLCFTPPRQSYASTAADVSGFLVTTDGEMVGLSAGLPPYQSSHTSFGYGTDGGITSTIILVEPAPRDRDLDQVIVSAMARGVGLDLRDQLEVINTLPLSLEEDVVAAVCLMYGDPPFCSD